MKKRCFWLVVSSLITLSLLLASCGGEEEEEEEVTVPDTKEKVTLIEEEEEEEEEVVQQTGIVPWWKKDPTAVPEYGGTFTWVSSSDIGNWDSIFGMVMGGKLWGETIAQENWMGTDPEEWDFLTRFSQIKYFTGGLAESWEIPDWQTMILHIRKGVHWHDKPPTNGRELTADDIAFSFHRLLGIGSGYTKPAERASTALYQPMESATATDKYTCVLKWSKEAPGAMRMCLDVTPWATIVPADAVKQYGDLQNWEHAQGTGPFILDDYVAASSVTTVRNPNYWGYDEFYPQNRLPYVDGTKMLVIPDKSTQYAALRTGKVDTLSGIDWQQAARFKETDPHLIQLDYWSYCFTIAMPVDREPWSDIRVRKAMQMAIDLDTIAKTYYGGIVPGTPVGTSGHPHYRAEYADWPQDVKDAFAYNPEGAKALLAEAGYPEGFKCTLTMSITHDVDLAQILQAYFKDIGVDMTIDSRERTVHRNLVMGGQCELAVPIWLNYTSIPPMDHFPHFTPGHYEHAFRHIDDPILNEMNATLRAELDAEKQRLMIIEADMYCISQFWTVNVLPTTTYIIYQPWVKRFAKVSTVPMGQMYSRLWIDQALKEAMQ